MMILLSVLVSFFFPAAWIIGHAGQKKREIENLSGAIVKVLNSAPANLAPHSQDGRILILKGKRREEETIADHCF